MSDIIPINAGKIVEMVLTTGDLSKLSAQQRTDYFMATCNSLGLNPLTKPFDFLTMNGKSILYATKTATDQLRQLHGVSVNITTRQSVNDVYTVTARAKDKTGREDESIGAVSIKGLVGDALANATMKAETKAKRRVTLSICGLGILDETEIETIIPNQSVSKSVAVPPHQSQELKNPESSTMAIQPVVPSQGISKTNDYVVVFGKKFLGKKLSEIDDTNLMEWYEKLITINELELSQPDFLNFKDTVMMVKKAVIERDLGKE